MTKVRILIVEDDAMEGEALQQSLIELGYSVTGIATNLQDALGLFYSQSPDVVIIDIYLGDEPDGLTVAEKINLNQQTRRPFIFLTNASDKDTFSKARATSPDSYLIKPFNPLEVQYAIELAIEKHHSDIGAFTQGKGQMVYSDRDLYVKKGNVLQKLALSAVISIAVDGKYCQLTTEASSYLIQWPLKALLEKLAPHDFMRIHRNYAVNLHMISQVHLKDQQVIMKNGQTFPVSQRFRETLTKHLDILK